MVLFAIFRQRFWQKSRELYQESPQGQSRDESLLLLREIKMGFKQTNQLFGESLFVWAINLNGNLCPLL
jgi:hypothetical protein